MMRIEQEGCDVFDVKDWPRVALDDVRKVEVIININGKRAQHNEGVMCAKALTRLLGFVDRAWKPPAKREKDSPDA